jgi:MFS family permease
MGLVGLAHCISHFSQLLLPPLFLWLKQDFNASYTELGVLLTIFFVVSCAVQALSGFVVDRFGPRPVLFAGIGLLALAAFGYALSTSYFMLASFSVVAGIGNGVFHPVDYTLLNRKVHPKRLGHAFSVHGITGSLGWALAPAMMVSITLASNWRVALASAGALTLVVMGVLWLSRAQLTVEMTSAATKPAAGTTHAPGREGSFDFLAIPAVWVCFAFFFLYAIVISGIQAFAPEAARQLHAVPAAWAAMCLTLYMVASACGMVLGGFLATDPARSEKIVGVGFGIAAVFALTIGFAPLTPMAVPVLFACMGVASGIAGPSRDLIVKRAAPPNATGRVYGVVYSGLDIGQAAAPLVFGPLLDLHRPADIWLGIALVQGLLILSAFNVGRVRRTALAPAAA